MSALTPREAGRLTFERALHRRPESERYAIARALEDELVTVVVDRHRDGENLEEVVGILLGMTTNPGVGAALVILRTERGAIYAESSARISRIFPGRLPE